MILLFVLIFIAYIASKVKLLPANANKVLADLVVNITNPATILYAVATSSHALSNAAVLSILGITLLTLGGQILFARGFTKVLRIDPRPAGVYRFMLVFSNCGFLGYPVLRTLFGADAVFVASMYNLIFQILCFTYGVRQVGGDPSARVISPRTFLTPMVITSVLALILYLTNVSFHPMIVETLSLLDRITSPASMLVIGCVLAAYPLKSIFGRWHIYVFCVVRLLVIPVIVWAILRMFVTDPLILGVMVVLSALPAATNTVLICTKYNGDDSTAASGIFLSTTLSLVTLPILLQLLF
jgi:predicted permease